MQTRYVSTNTKGAGEEKETVSATFSTHREAIICTTPSQSVANQHASSMLSFFPFSGKDLVVSKAAQQQPLSIIRPSFTTFRIKERTKLTYLVLQTMPYAIANSSLSPLSKDLRDTLRTIRISTTRKSLFTISGTPTSGGSFRHHMSTIALQNRTNFPESTLNAERGWLLTLLIPIAVVIAVGAIIMLVCCLLKKQSRRTRARKWNSNVENSISWFEAFELPHAVGNMNVMSDLAEPADFSIPMGPLCMNNFAFENYDTTTEDSMMNHFSTKRKLRKEFHHSRRCSDVHPTDRPLATNIDKGRATSNHALKNNHAVKNTELEGTSNCFQVINNYK